MIEHPQGIGRSGGPPSGGAGGDRYLGKGPGKNPGPRRAGDGAPPSLAGRRNAGGGASDDALPPGADADAKGRGAAEGGGPRKVRPGRPRRAARPRRWGAITGPTGWPARPGHRPAPSCFAPAAIPLRAARRRVSGRVPDRARPQGREHPGETPLRAASRFARGGGSHSSRRRVPYPRPPQRGGRGEGRRPQRMAVVSSSSRLIISAHVSRSSNSIGWAVDTSITAS